MPVDIPQRSRQRFSDLFSVDGFEFWDLIDFPTIPVQPDDSQYTVLQTDRLDTLAHKFYNDVIYWWVIAVANDIDEPQSELSLGRVLRIPSPRYVREVLFLKVRV
jgi:nucleoid-associated protein YgaU